MTARLQSLRQRVWPSELREVGEALRDLHGFCEQLTLCAKVSVTNVVWSEPFFFTLDQRPDIVQLGDARVGGTLDSVATSTLDWRTEPTDGRKVRVRINRAETLVPGKVYDLKFLVVY
jgi:hypothetical protein